MGAVHFFYDLIIVAFRGDEAGMENPFIKKALGHVGLERAEDIPGTEMNPFRCVQCILRNGGDIELRQVIACGLPVILLGNAFLC